MELNKFALECNKILRLKKLPNIICSPYNVFNDVPINILALADYNNNIIYLRDIMFDKYDIYIAIAHQLMHFKQLEIDRNTVLYSIDEFQDVFKEGYINYYTSTIELEANAFAVIALTNIFKVLPLFSSLNSHIVKLIYEQADEMINEIVNAIK